MSTSDGKSTLYRCVSTAGAITFSIAFAIHIHLLAPLTGDANGGGAALCRRPQRA